MTVTELANIPLASGCDISDKGSDANKAWENMCATVARQNGCQGIFFGQQLENPSIAQLFVNWDKIESHQAFEASPEYAPMLERLTPILGGPPELVHYNFGSPGNLTAALSAPITELATFYLSDESSSWTAKMESFQQVLVEHAKGFLGTSWGWSVEDVEYDGLDGGKKGKAALLGIGWQSKDAHMAFRETEAFKKAIEPLKDGPKAVEMHHIICKTTS